MMKFLMLLFVVQASVTLAKTSVPDQYVPLCVDLARRVVTDKVTFYQNYKRSNSHKSLRSTASLKNFTDFPQVINKNVDIKIVKLIIASVKNKKLAKNFTQKIEAEDRLINGLAGVINSEGKPFLNSCVGLYKVVEKKCNAFISKDFNRYTACLSSLTSDKAPYVAKFIPFLNYKQKIRSVASK